MIADDWYRKFYSMYYADKTLRFAEEVPDPKWTSMMSGFLRTVADTLGYRVVSESKVVGNGRIDQRWTKDGSTVVVEHENDSTGIDNEIQKLCNDGSDLRVLITYVPDEDFVANAAEIADRVASGIDKCQHRRVEFLLLVAGYKDADWTGYRFATRVKPEAIRTKRIKV
jgi:hypothetical protein